MNLIIFPGESSPYDKNNNLNILFKLIVDYAEEQGYSDIVLPLYPGHIAYDQTSELTLASSVRIMTETIEAFEEKEEPYLIITRSFGCFGLIEVLKSKELNYCNKVIFWGVPQYYLCWKELYYRYDENLKSAQEQVSTRLRIYFMN